MKKSLFIAALVLFALTAARQAGAVGFHHLEHSALSTGMGNARTALWDDASSLFFNPAAITELRGFQLSIGDTLFVPKGGYTPLSEDERNPENGGHGDLDGVNSSGGDERVIYPFHLFFTAETTRWLTLGIGITNPFGLGSFWPKDWDGRFISTQMMLRTFFFQPTAAVSISRLLKLPDDILISFGIGVNYVYGDIKSSRQVDLSNLTTEGESEATMKLDGTTHGFGANYALLIAWKPWFSVGFSARSNVRLRFSGNAGFHGIDPAIAEALEAANMGLPESTGYHSSINLPWNMNLGIAFHGLKKFTFAVDLYIAFWESYDELRVYFDCVEEGTCLPTLNDEAVFQKNWKKGYQICAGAEYRPIKELAIRLGYGYITDPTNPKTYDPINPDGNRNIVTAGIGYRAPRYFKVDLGYLFVWWEGKKNNEVGAPSLTGDNGYANGTYNVMVHLIALTLGFSFGGPDKGKPMTMDD